MRKNSVFFVVTIAACVLGPPENLHGSTIISPSEFTDVDAPGYASPWPAGGFRAMQIDHSSVFASLPEGGAWLTEIALRPDRNVPVGSRIDIETLTLRLSVTDVDPLDMSDEFAENLGREVVEVYDGPWAATVESPAGRVRDFDYIFTLMNPFFYDPDEGNLLIDWNFGEPTGTLPGNTTRHDLTNDFVAETRSTWSESRGIDAPIGSPYRFSSVVQFRFATQAGDFDADSVLTETDIDLLTEAMIAADPDAQFDLNDDGDVDFADRTMWVHDLKQTWYGDANLDGEFSSVDFVSVFQTGKFEAQQPASWSEGDWNGDGIFSTSDFVTAFQDGGYETGPRVAQAVAVPEPSSGVLMLAAVVVLICLFRSQVAATRQTWLCYTGRVEQADALTFNFRATEESESRRTPASFLVTHTR